MIKMVTMMLTVQGLDDENEVSGYIVLSYQVLIIIPLTFCPYQDFKISEYVILQPY